MCRKILMPVYVLVAVMIGTAGSRAAADPSSDDMISALKRDGLRGPSRGIRAVGPSSMPDPESAAPQRHRAEKVSESGSLDLSVQFASGSAELTPAATHLLDRLGHALSSPALAGDRFRIEGHTDTVGTAEANKALSQQRAERVARYLQEKFNVDASRLAAEGVGEDDLLVRTADQVPEPRNRRVHIVNLGA